MSRFQTDYREIYGQLIQNQAFRVGVASGVTVTLLAVAAIWLILT